MNAWHVVGLLAAYVAVLFACAYYGERDAVKFSQRVRLVLFSLTLGVYCTSWTFYGSVGASVRDPLSFLPIYLGPVLFLWLGYDMWQRLIVIRQQYHINSIADFIAARYGKSSYLGAMVAVLALFSILPYLALQLHAIDMSATVLLHGLSASTPHAVNGVLILTVVLSGLAMLFGTRNISSTERHHGLMLAVAVESAVKLCALIAVAAYAIFAQPSADVVSRFVTTSAQQFDLLGWSNGFWTQTLLAACAMFCLPRQFHVSVVECSRPAFLSGARLGFALYLILTVLAIIPISGWALSALDSLANPDMAVLLLPLAAHENGLALIAFLGGFSAATGMLLVSTITLSIMLSNDLIIPVLWRLGIARQEGVPLLPLLLRMRRVAILVVMFLGYSVFQLFGHVSQLSAFGLLAFAGVAQFAPAMIGGLYWRGGSKQGAMAGLLGGFVLWTYCLILPALLKTISVHSVLYPTASQLLTNGLFGWSALRPEALFGVRFVSPLTHGVMWSLSCNLLLFVVVSRHYRPSVIEQIQAEPFLDPLPSKHTYFPTQQYITDLALPSEGNEFKKLRLSIGDLAALCGRVVGHDTMRTAFEAFAHANQTVLLEQDAADASWWQLAEQLLASVVGAASARTLLTSALSDQDFGIAQIASLLDQTSQWQRFSQKLLMTMMNHLTQGVSVVDQQLKLVAWNKRYIDLFGYPPELIYVGCHVANLIRYNALQGTFGDGAVEMHVHKRLERLKAGQPHHYERVRSDGRVIEMRGQPIEGGGFVTTFADITGFRQTEAMLESRVIERTEQLEISLKEQRFAREQADQANLSKSKFVAAASHDLLQPMHAARLFSASLEQSELSLQDRQTLAQLERSLHGAESILTALLDVARLDAGAIQPRIESVYLAELLRDLSVQYAPIAAQRGLTLRIHQTNLWVLTDAQWLRRIIQNLLSNALRYTSQGRIVVGVLGSAVSESNHIRICVWDTGPGIPPEQINNVFNEFQCGDNTSPWGEKGIGLGLAIVQRMVLKLKHHIHVYSRVPAQMQGAVGCCFTLTLPRTTAQVISAKPLGESKPLGGLSVLCVDNEVDILDGMNSLLSKWGCLVYMAKTPMEAIRLSQQHPIDVWLVDYHLGADVNGLTLIQEQTQGCPAALITANSDERLVRTAKQLGVTLIHKPLKPAVLRAFLSAVQKR